MYLNKKVHPERWLFEFFSSNSLDINKIKVDINNFHYILGHTNERVLRNTSRYLDVSLLGTLDI